MSKETCAFLDYINGKVSNDSFVQRIEERIHMVKRKEQEEREYMIFEMRLREERAAAAKEAAEKAHAEGKAEGKVEGKAEAVHSLIEALDCTKEKAMDLLKIPPEMQPKILALL